MTDHDRLQQLVREMRSAQREYFQTRSGDALSRAKQLEREVDRQLKEAADKQAKMF